MPTIDQLGLALSLLLTLLIAGVGGWVAFKQLRRMGPTRVISSREAEREVLECPRCGEAMMHGFLLAPRGLFWRDDTTATSRWFPSKPLPNTLNAGFRKRENVAWQCRGCALLLCDVSQMVEK